MLKLQKANANNDSPSQPKRQFLKKGEGIARFEVKPGQRPPRPRKPTTKTSVAQASATQKSTGIKSTMWFPNRFDTSRAVQPPKLASGWKFWIKEFRLKNCTICVAKTKVLISCAVTAPCFRIGKNPVFSCVACHTCFYPEYSVGIDESYL